MNLISNAYKFTPTGGITFSIKSISKFDDSNFERRHFLEFTISDTGVGIPEKDIQYLFKMFGTINKYRKDYNCRGTGIGLTISKKLTESLGGTISLHSLVGVGTEVIFTVKENIIEPKEAEIKLNYDHSDIELSSSDSFEGFQKS